MNTPTQHTRKNVFWIGILAWLAMLGVDFFLHAGLLARLYMQPSPFLLPPLEAFRLIPVGYFSFLLLNALLFWLMLKLGIATGKEGFRFGLILGASIWGALTLGLYSIASASPALLAGWFFGQAIELGIAGAVIGSGLSGMPLKKLAWRVTGLILGLIIITVIMQNTGLAPAAIIL